MAYISVPEGIPGIRSLVMFRPETGKHLYDLAQVLLRNESPLTSAERELIATHVSSRNNCTFCMMSHAAAARELYGDQKEVVDCVISDATTAPEITACCRLAANSGSEAASYPRKRADNASSGSMECTVR